MQLSAVDYALVQLAHHGAAPLRALGNLESHYLRDRLDTVEIDRPVFITGLARAGTTILLQQLSETGSFATHQYRDFPFLTIPWSWNRYLDLASASQSPVPRPHQDRIQITASSPEAFEEPLWQMFFPQVHKLNANHRLDEQTTHPAFEQFFSDHLKKVLLTRGRSRYLSKGNYNVTRLEYLGKLFPDAQFIIPIRHPVAHVASLVRQHQLFLEYGQADRRVGRYLEAAGHYEFGPQRVPISLTPEDAHRTTAAWNANDETLGYAIQWAQVYRHVDALRHSGDDLSTRLKVIRYEDFCASPATELAGVLAHTGTDAELLSQLNLAAIEASALPQSEGRGAETVWREAGLVAQLFGYEEPCLPGLEKTAKATQASAKADAAL